MNTLFSETFRSISNFVDQYLLVALLPLLLVFLIYGVFKGFKNRKTLWSLLLVGLSLLLYLPGIYFPVDALWGSRNLVNLLQRLMSMSASWLMVMTLVEAFMRMEGRKSPPLVGAWVTWVLSAAILVLSFFNLHAEHASKGLDDVAFSGWFPLYQVFTFFPLAVSALYLVPKLWKQFTQVRNHLLRTEIACFTLMLVSGFVSMFTFPLSIIFPMDWLSAVRSIFLVSTLSFFVISLFISLRIRLDSSSLKE